MRGEDYWRDEAVDTDICTHCGQEIFLIQHNISSHWYHFFNENGMCPNNIEMATPGGSEDLPLEMTNDAS